MTKNPNPTLRHYYGIVLPGDDKPRQRRMFRPEIKPAPRFAVVCNNGSTVAGGHGSRLNLRDLDAWYDDEAEAQAEAKRLRRRNGQVIPVVTWTEEV